MNKSYEYEKIIPMSPLLIRHFENFLKNPDSVYLNLPTMFKIENLDIKRFERAINKIVDRHEMLRCTFSKVDGKYYTNIKKHLDFKIDVLDSINLNNLIKPFDLINGPLFRICIYENLIFMDFSHVIIDGISFGIFFHELNIFYKGNDIKGINLPPSEDLMIPESVYKENADYWRQFLEKPFKKTSLNIDKKSTNDVGPCITVYYPIPKEFMEDVKTYTLKNQVTTYVLCITALCILLAAINDSEDIFINTNMSARNLKNIKSIGLFTTPISMRYTFDKKYLINDLLVYAKNMNDEFLKHQHVRSDVLHKEFNITRNDLSSIGFIFQRKMISEIKIDDKICEPIPIPEKEMIFEILMSFFDSKTFPGIQLEYHSDLFERESIDKLLDDYLFVMKTIVNNEEKTVEDLIEKVNKKTSIIYGKTGKTTDGLRTITELFNIS